MEVGSLQRKIFSWRLFSEAWEISRAPEKVKTVKKSHDDYYHDVIVLVLPEVS